jgi:hypothetical protein
MVNRLIPDISKGECETFDQALREILDELPEKITIERLAQLLEIRGADTVIRSKSAIDRLRKPTLPKKLRATHIEMIARALNCSEEQEIRLLKAFGCSRLIDGL